MVHRGGRGAVLVDVRLARILSLVMLATVGFAFLGGPYYRARYPRLDPRWSGLELRVAGIEERIFDERGPRSSGEWSYSDGVREWEQALGEYPAMNWWLEPHLDALRRLKSAAGVYVAALIATGLAFAFTLLVRRRRPAWLFVLTLTGSCSAVCGLLWFVHAARAFVHVGETSPMSAGPTELAITLGCAWGLCAVASVACLILAGRSRSAREAT